MNQDEFREWSLRAAQWGADYRAHVRDFPVRAQTEPGEIAAQIAPAAPDEPQAMDAIFEDFEKIIIPGITHWQHPRFFAYFPANAAPASVIAEQLVNTIASQCMLWQASPAATELETSVLDWLRQAIGLPSGFKGVIQDSASSATLAAVLTMRERTLEWAGNERGLSNQPRLRVYASGEVHTSIDRAIWVAGIGQENLIRIATKGPLRSIDVDALEAQIVADRAAGYLPLGVVASVGGTSVGGTDHVGDVCRVAHGHNLMVHVDAAWAGSAMICPEFRHYWEGIEVADSVIFNPHKWLGAQFDCCAHFLKKPEDLVRTLAIQPEYLKSHGRDGVINYSEWSVPLGRRFRALKIWFLLRAYGLEGLRNMIRNHVSWAQELCEQIRALPDFVIVTDPMLSLFSFRYVREGAGDIDALNQRLVDAINNDGRIYLTQTRVDGALAIRFQVGQFETTQADVASALDVIREMSGRL